MKVVAIKFVGMLIASALLFAVGSFANTASATTPSPTVRASAKLPTTGPTDRELQALIGALESLPNSVKNANPQSPGYQAKLQKALGAGKHGRPAVNWIKCGWEVGKFVASIGIPVAKIVLVLKAAYKTFKTVRNVIAAIRTGHAAEELGSQSVEILQKLLGIDSILIACF